MIIEMIVVGVIIYKKICKKIINNEWQDWNRTNRCESVSMKTK